MLANSAIVAFVATTDPSRAKAFYRDVLGLLLISEDEYALVFDAHGTMLRVAIVREIVLAPYTVLGWQVSDIDATVRGLAAKGVQVRTLRLDGTERPWHLERPQRCKSRLVQRPGRQSAECEPALI